MAPSRSVRRTAAAVAAAAICLVPATTNAASSSGGDTQVDPVSERPSSERANPLTASEYVGVDGETHRHSPILIRGRNGTVYFGEEFDGACGYGQKFDQGLKRLARLARVIEKSGRRVVFTVPPNKSAVMKRDILKSQLPHASCDLQGIAQQDRALDTFDDRNYVGLRKGLAAQSANGQKNLFWPIDTHWTRIGAQAWVKALSQRLDAKLADRQTVRRGRETIETDVSFLGIIPKTTERGPAVFTSTPVRVDSEPTYDPSRQINPMHTWTTSPASRAWGGRTLLLGDSFTYRALDNLMALFAKGQFIWFGQPGIPSIPEAIANADTVVIEVVQRYVPISPLTERRTFVEVRQALASAKR